MKAIRIRLAALVLAVLLLCGCGNVQQKLDFLRKDYTAYSDMEYSRPDMEQMDELLQNVIEVSKGDDLQAVLERIYAFNDFYDQFQTSYALADIRYCGDLTDLYWEEEYEFCMEASAAVDAALEEMYYALAKSPCRNMLEKRMYFGPDFFDAYEGENEWDEQFIRLLEQEAQLQSRYYELSETALDYEIGTEQYYEACGEEMAQLLTDLIRVRHRMAEYWGYDDYIRFANDFYHYRDYSPEDAARYLEDIARELAPLYVRILDAPQWEQAERYCTEKETYDYVRDTARAMGGTVQEAFKLMDMAGLYDISYGENKYNSSFEVYLTAYWEPFVFMNPTMTVYDKLVLAHEFGHFCNDFASYGSYAGTDVAEVFSHGMEYLSLCYAEDAEELQWVKMADSLCLFVEQAAFAAFEQRMYELPEEELTVDNLRDLFDEVVREYGFDAIEYTDWEFVNINHYYTNPMYIISYVFSNDAALQLYQMEREEPGTGLACFEETLDTEALYYLEYLQEAGLESPFAEGRVARIRSTLEEALQ